MCICISNLRARSCASRSKVEIRRTRTPTKLKRLGTPSLPRQPVWPPGADSLLRRRGLQNRRQAIDLAFDQGRKRFRPAAVGFGNLGAERSQPLLDRLFAQALAESIRELVNDRLRRTFRREDRVERRAVELWQALLVRGRHVRQQRAAFFRGD